MKLEYVESAIASRSNALDGVRNVPNGAAYVISPVLLLNLVMTRGTRNLQDKAALNAFKLGIKKQLMSRSNNRPSIGPNAVGSAHGGSRRASNSGTPDVATNAMYQTLLGDSGQSLPLSSHLLEPDLRTLNSGSPFGWFATGLTCEEEY